ncbi:MAG: hypothetical protein ABJB95_11100 [Gemmatimonadales bacterium]
MPRLIRFISLFLLLGIVTASAQTPTSPPRPYAFSVSAGPTRSFRGGDAPGIQGQAGVEYTLAHGFGLKLEGARHRYEQQALYRCVVLDGVNCYQAMRRDISTGVLSATYHISRFANDEGVPYLISGVGLYRTRHIATHYSTCQPADLCTDPSSTFETRNTQFGWSGGIGADFKLGPVPVLAEMRVHYIYRDTPTGQPSNDFFLWPFSIGVRF